MGRRKHDDDEIRPEWCGRRRFYRRNNFVSVWLTSDPRRFLLLALGKLRPASSAATTTTTNNNNNNNNNNNKMATERPGKCKATCPLRIQLRAFIFFFASESISRRQSLPREPAIEWIWLESPREKRLDATKWFFSKAVDLMSHWYEIIIEIIW